MKNALSMGQLAGKIKTFTLLGLSSLLLMAGCQTPPDAPEGKTVTVEVEGLSCPFCLPGVQAIVSGLGPFQAKGTPQIADRSGVEPEFFQLLGLNIAPRISLGIEPPCLMRPTHSAFHPRARHPLRGNRWRPS